MAGKGERAETTIPKQYIIIDGKPIYEYCLLQFYRNKNIDKIILNQKDFILKLKFKTVIGQMEMSYERQDMRHGFLFAGEILR